jgi:hypothetical protein
MFAVASDSIRDPLPLVYLVVALPQDSCLNYCMSRNNMYKLKGLRWPLFLIPSISNLNDTRGVKNSYPNFIFFSKKKDLRSHMIACSCKFWNISSENSKGKNKGHFLGKTITPKTIMRAKLFCFST